MRIIKALLGLALAFTFNHASAVNDPQLVKACEASLAEQQVIVDTAPLQVNAPQRVSLDRLAERSADPENPKLEHGVVFGMTLAKPKFDLSYQFAQLTNEQTGETCVVPDIKLTLGYTPVDILVADDLEVGTCEEQLVQAHEREHVEVYGAHMESIRAQVTSELRLELSRVVFVGESEEKAQFLASAAVDELMRKAVYPLAEAVLTKHAEVDSSENLREARLACGGKLNELALSRLGK